jgi:hypothetical protein
MSSSKRTPRMRPSSNAALPNEIIELSDDFTRSIGLPRRFRIARYGVHGDGSCAYHSMCAALNLDDYVHRTDSDQKRIAYEFRCNFQSSFSKGRFTAIRETISSGYEKPFKDVKEAFCDPRVWADEVTIKHAAKVLGANIIFVDSDRLRYYCGVHDEDAVKAGHAGGAAQTSIPTMVIFWCNHMHFEPLAQILEVRPNVTRIKLLFFPHKSVEDAQFVDSLMGAYSKQCNI